MIFRDIKQHNKVYILDKMNVTIDEGIVTAVGIPQPNLEGKIVIDVTINVKDKQATYTILNSYPLLELIIQYQLLIRKI